jgi:oxaloacetate decarboxylase alpha subunit
VTDLQLLDVSIRDGNQSLWGATGLTTPQILQIAPIMDRVGFRALDFTSSTHMGVAVRTHRENPWERIRLTHAAMPNTPLQFIGTGFRFISWETVHPELIKLAYERLVAAGMARFVVLDPMHDMDAVRASARTLRAVGAKEIIAALTFTLSEVHDDAYYAELAEQMAASPHVDRVYIKDPAGLLAPERARTLIPAVRARLAGKPLELHAHCTIGLSPLTYLAAADLGVEVLQVACGPLAGGTSLPDAQRVTANLRELGHTVDIDDRLLAQVADYFARLADAESLPAGAPQEYDASFLRHQVAGGVMTTLRRQLAELGLADRFDEVIDEVVRVRAELGHPIMVTPFPQIVCSQALNNVIGSERYGNVPDQVIRYVLGSFGRPTAPVDPDVRDRILSRRRAAELRAEPPPLPPAELRKRFAPGIADEELLLRATMPGDQVDAMLAAGPAARHYNPDLKGVLDLLRELRTRPAVSDLVVDKPGFRLELRSADSAGPAADAATDAATEAATDAASDATTEARRV